MAPATPVHIYPPSPALSDDACLSKPLLERPAQPSYQRQLGDSELSYYLPSRADGVNDMYLHLGFRVPDRIVQYQRVCAIWALLRGRHPLLASTVDMRSYDDVSFLYTPPLSPDDALAQANATLEFRHQPKDELISTYLNGPRTLSNDRLSYLILSDPGPRSHSLPTPPGSPVVGYPVPNSDVTREYDLLICAAHFIGDGMALHRFANDFLRLLGGKRTQEDLEKLIRDEWQERWTGDVQSHSVLPAAVEDSIPKVWGTFRQLASTVDFQNNQSKQIGGHGFPRRSGAARHTIVPTVSFDQDTTKKVLKKCKSHGVSIANALFAICNVVWTRTSSNKPDLPMMMYSALNLRPFLLPDPPNDSYWFLAIGYFNIVLPNFLLRSFSDDSVTLWHRAKSAKEQAANIVKNPMLIPRTHAMARERGQRARKWAKEDDDKARGIWVPPSKPTKIKTDTNARPPSTALIGLSLLGNLDGIYQHALFPDVVLHTLTTGSRQRPGGMLLFGYTFAGKLWLSLGYDENGFERDVVDRFWGDVVAAVDEFLL